VRRATTALLIAVLVSGCGGGGQKSKDHGSVTAAGPPEAQTVTVGMNDKLQFTPNVVAAKVGSLTLTVKNLGAVSHNLVFDTKGQGGSDTIQGGRSEDVTTVFRAAGTFTFVCTFHPGMDGRVVVS
jgi:plastocyanin